MPDNNTLALLILLVVAIAAFVVMVKNESWIIKVICFIVSIVAVNAAMGLYGVGSGPVALINAIVVIASSVFAFQSNTRGGKVFGFVTLFIGLLLAIPIFQDIIGVEASGTAWGAFVSSFQAIMNTILQPLTGGA